MDVGGAGLDPTGQSGRSLQLARLFAGGVRSRLVAVAFAACLAIVGLAPVSATTNPTASVANPAVSCPEVDDSVVRLYSAYFLRQPDANGLAYWLERYRHGERNLRQISEAFAAAPEFEATYGDLDSGAFVTLVYQNVLQRTPDAGGAAYWTGRLDAGLSRGAMMIGFSESLEFIEQTDTALPVAGRGRIYPVGTSFACGTGTTVDLLRTGHRPTTVDVLGVNVSSRAQNLLVWADHDEPVNTHLVANEIVEAHQYLLLWQIDLPAASQTRHERVIRLDHADDDLHWIVAAYPSGMAVDRPGWDHSPPLQLR